MWEFGATGKAFRKAFGYPRGWAPQPKGQKTSVSAPSPSSVLGILLPHQAKQFTFFFFSFCSQQGSSEEDKGPCCMANVHGSGGPPREGQSRDGTTRRPQYKFGLGTPLTNHHMTGKMLAFPIIP